MMVRVRVGIGDVRAAGGAAGGVAGGEAVVERLKVGFCEGEAAGAGGVGGGLEGVLEVVEVLTDAGVGADFGDVHFECEGGWPGVSGVSVCELWYGGISCCDILSSGDVTVEIPYIDAPIFSSSSLSNPVNLNSRLTQLLRARRCLVPNVSPKC